MPERVLVASHDPGGAHALKPVISRIKATLDWDMLILANKLAQPILGTFGSKCELPTDWTHVEAEQHFNAFKPTLLFTGTSLVSNAEQRLRNVANRKGVCSVAVLDYWMNYSWRWEAADYSLNELADTVCVMDEMTGEEMQREGFCTDQLAVTGQPYIESLWQDASKQQSSYEVLSKVLFLSQPFELIGAEGIQDHPLKVMAAALSDLAASQGRAIATKVRMHPKEVGSEAFNTMLQSLEGSACKYSLAGKKESLSDLLDWADVVVGYTTVALFEARAQGKHCIGLDIVTGKYEALRSAMRTAGIQLVAPNKEAILRALNARSNVEPVLNAFHLGATEAVIKTIQQLMPTAF